MVNKNEITLIAVESDGTCNHCMFNANVCCVPSRKIWACTPNFRTDGKHVIWTIKPDKPAVPVEDLNDPLGR